MWSWIIPLPREDSRWVCLPKSISHEHVWKLLTKKKKFSSHIVSSEDLVSLTKHFKIKKKVIVYKLYNTKNAMTSQTDIIFLTFPIYKTCKTHIHNIYTHTVENNFKGIKMEKKIENMMKNYYTETTNIFIFNETFQLYILDICKLIFFVFVFYEKKNIKSIMFHLKSMTLRWLLCHFEVKRRCTVYVFRIKRELYSVRENCQTYGKDVFFKNVKVSFHFTEMLIRICII